MNIEQRPKISRTVRYPFVVIDAICYTWKPTPLLENLIGQQVGIKNIAKPMKIGEWRTRKKIDGIFERKK